MKNDEAAALLVELEEARPLISALGGWKTHTEQLYQLANHYRARAEKAEKSGRTKP